MDLTCCFLALPFLAMFTGAIGLLIWAVSPGPIFFRQERVGLLGRRFYVFKFRTMHVAAEDRHRWQRGAVSLSLTRSRAEKLKYAGLIPGAWLLRATGLDEFPQIINVLRGEMSIVGPRPAFPAEFALSSSLQRQRFCNLPGLIGLSQIAAAQRTTRGELIRLEIAYAQKKTLWLDLKIMVLTIPALIRQIREERRARLSVGLVDGHSQSAR